MAEENNTGMGPQSGTTDVTEKEVILSDGRKAVIRKGKGRDVKAAMRVSGADSSIYLFALIAQLTTIEGNAIVMEDLEDMGMADVTKLQTEFAELNF